jgi:two-component system sensor histidine kinase PilS (NtrC family)
VKSTGASTAAAAEPPYRAASRAAGDGFYPSHWRSLDYFNLTRLSVAAVLALLALLFADTGLLGRVAAGQFRVTALIYLILAAFFVLSIRARWPAFTAQLTAHILTDIVMVSALMSAAGGVRSGLGLVLMVSLASAGLAGRMRLVLLYAALASIAVLTHGLAGVVAGSADVDAVFQAGLLALGYFATGALAHALTQRALTGERLAEARAREAAALARVNQIVIDDMPDGMLVVDAAGRVRHCNARALALTGQTGSAATPGCTLEDLDPGLAHAYRQWRGGHGARRVALAERGDRAPLEARLLPVEGTNGDVRVNGDDRANGDGGARAEGAVIVLEDMSRAEARAREIKLAALGRLTANIAHEIRNPLSAISHAAQLLAEEPEPDPTRARLLAIIGDNTRRLDRMVGDVLELNRRDRVRPELLRLDEYLMGFVGEFAQASDLPAHAVGVQAVPLTLCFDRGHLHQVLWNLLRNAWRHGTQAPGSVRVTARDVDGQTELRVEDDGPGVADEVRAHLFEPFFTTDSRGAGLGLYIARELAQANGASLMLEDGVAGACFILKGRNAC